MARKRKLVKSKKNKILTGVLGGIGDYFGVDATVVRVIFLGTLAITGVVPGVITYIVASLTMK